jgi:thiol-disulfide isomerase/thioredoxin
MLSLPAAVAILALSAAGNGQTVLLDFYADWCGPCHSMDSTVQALSAKGYPVCRVNVDQERDLANRFGVQGIPCFVMIVDGREAGREVGRTSIGRLEQLCALGRAAPAGPTMLAAQPRTQPVAPASAGNTAPRRTPVIPVSWSGEQQRPPASDAALLAASVRLRIEDPQGRSCGSGTIIDARPGSEALILTCGHIFRDSNGQGRIEIDVYGPAPASHVPGRLVAYDLKRDVALVAFEPQGEITVARVAPPGFSVRQGEAVASVGCNDGADPTVQHSSVVKLDRYLGPPNLQVSGQPVPGRSGGGLFTADGMVVGVCNAADPSDHEGLFAALASIHAQLDELGLSAVYRQPPSGPAPV